MGRRFIGPGEDMGADAETEIRVFIEHRAVGRVVRPQMGTDEVVVGEIFLGYQTDLIEVLVA